MEQLLIALAIGGILILSWLRRLQRRHSPHRSRRDHPRSRPAASPRPYVGDFTGQAHVQYVPVNNARPDPGEVVWTWVPFEEDHSRGKDRPVLLIAHDGPWLLGLQLSSNPRVPGATSAVAKGPQWHEIGSGPWDAQRRVSFVRLDRIIRVDPSSVRREGAILDRRRFDDVARSLRRVHHW